MLDLGFNECKYIWLVFLNEKDSAFDFVRFVQASNIPSYYFHKDEDGLWLLEVLRVFGAAPLVIMGDFFFHCLGAQIESKRVSTSSCHFVFWIHAMSQVLSWSLVASLGEASRSFPSDSSEFSSSY